MAGIKETKDVLDFILSICVATGKSLEDGEFNFTDTVNYFSALQKADDAITGASNVIAELSDLDAKERDELFRFCENKFHIPQKDVEKVVKSGLRAGISIAEIVGDLLKKNG